MAQPAEDPKDSDLTKGAVEKVLDSPGAPPRDEQWVPCEAIDITEHARDADRKDVQKAEDALGADENGTPG